MSESGTWRLAAQRPPWVYSYSHRPLLPLSKRAEGKVVTLLARR